MKSETALSWALDCNYIDITKYLYNNNFQVLDHDYVSSLEVMQLVHSWGHKFSENAIDIIINLWNTNIIDKLSYLFSIHHITTMKILWFSINEDVPIFFLKYASHDILREIMIIAINNLWF